MAELAPDTCYTLVPFEPINEKSMYSEEQEDALKFEVNTVNTKILWHEYPDSITIHLPSKEPQILKVGDFITFEGRKGSGAIIIKIRGYADEEGPTGFTFLPWRDDPTRENGRWATPQYSLRGNIRFIICYPCGVHYYGQHIMWNTLEIINHLAPITNPEFQKKLIEVTTYLESE
jgi:hypothetical protein